jgi:hypothetical protein
VLSSFGLSFFQEETRVMGIPSETSDSNHLSLSCMAGSVENTAHTFQGKEPPWWQITSTVHNSFVSLFTSLGINFL